MSWFYWLVILLCKDNTKVVYNHNLSKKKLSFAEWSCMVSFAVKTKIKETMDNNMNIIRHFNLVL